eukprot:jgi/Botrbrau1/9271/Bobra.180_1s0028.1
MGSSGLPYGLQAMLKDGHKHLAGLDEAVYRNIDACKQFAQIIRSSMGPRGMNKMVINHLDKLFVTNDTATIINELEVEHPAAKLLVLAAKAQEFEVGDCTNFVISFGGALLAHAEGLLRDGLHTTEVADGYAEAGKMALDILELQVIPGSEDLNLRDATTVAKRLRGAVGSKQYGYEDILCPLIAQACILVCPKNAANFNVDNVRVVKIPGAGAADSRVVKGMVIKRGPEGVITDVQDAKVAVFAQGVDAASTETKGTVLIHTAAELESYSKQEEDLIESLVKGIADSGAKVVVAGSAIGEMALHFIEKYGLMAVRIPSKFDLRRFCRAVGATALAKLAAPSADELGFAKSLRVEEIGGTRVIVLEQDAAQGAIATIVLRSATDQVLDDLERAVDDGVNAFKVMSKDARMVAAGGAVEMEIARQLWEHARGMTGVAAVQLQQAC